MSDSSYPGAASSSPSKCPTCGIGLPAGARFCPNCGTRVQQGAAYDPNAFRTAVDDVLDDREQEGDTSTASPASSDLDTIQIPTERGTPATDDVPAATAWEPVTVSPRSPPTEPAPPTWTATPSDWTIQTTPGSATPPPTRRRENKTLWIILAIFGGIVFCCCALFFLLFAVSSADSSFQSEVSFVAAFIWITSCAPSNAKRPGACAPGRS